MKKGIKIEIKNSNHEMIHDVIMDVETFQYQPYQFVNGFLVGGNFPEGTYYYKTYGFDIVKRYKRDHDTEFGPWQFENTFEFIKDFKLDANVNGVDMDFHTTYDRPNRNFWEGYFYNQDIPKQIDRNSVVKLTSNYEGLSFTDLFVIVNGKFVEPFYAAKDVVVAKNQKYILTSRSYALATDDVNVGDFVEIYNHVVISVIPKEVYNQQQKETQKSKLLSQMEQIQKQLNKL
jgi:hypothetical protein